MKKILSVLCLSLLLLPGYGQAELKFGGEASLEADVFAQPSGNMEDVSAELKIRPHASVKIGTILFYAEGDIRMDTEGWARGVVEEIPDQHGERKVLDMREIYADYSEGALQLRAGKQIFDFSALDNFSVADQANARDFSDPIDWERLGAPALSIRYGYDTFFQAVIIPWLTSSRLPVEGGRWERQLPDGFSLADQEVPENERGQYLARVGTDWKGYMLGLSYFNGYSYSPIYEIYQAPLGFELVPEYDLQEVLAVTASTSFGDYSINAELGFVDQNRRDDFFQYGLNIIRLWDGVFQSGDGLRVLLQYTGEAVTHKAGPAFDEIDFRRVLDGIQTEIEYTFSNERWGVKLVGAYNQDDGDTFVEPSLSYKGGDWETQAGIRVFSGDEESFFGGYDKNDGVFIQLTWHF